MKTDELKDLITKHREQFDDKKVPEHVWPAIKNQLFKKNTLFTALSMWRAAAILFMGISVYLMVTKEEQKKNTISLSEFTDTENFYTRQILDKTSMIDFVNNDGLDKYEQGIRQLEIMYIVLREELNNNPTKEVKDALVLNLLVRVSLLNQSLYESEKKESKHKMSS